MIYERMVGIGCSICVAWAAATFGGCASTSKSKKTTKSDKRGPAVLRNEIRDRAAFEFRCEPDSITIENLVNSNGFVTELYLVEACGTRAVYSCGERGCLLDSAEPSAAGPSPAKSEE